MSIVQVIPARERDLGGFVVRRVLPFESRQMVGPFIFFDHMGPTNFAQGQGIDVRPHPHISLATVTYLFSGVLEHRDSLGTVRTIRPGDALLREGRMGVLDPGSLPRLRAHGVTRAMLLGGERFPRARHIWWNFVASSQDRIEQAKGRWQRGQFAKVPGETEFIPLPSQ